MSRPNVNFIAQSFLPSAAFSFALRLRDHRLLWAVNCASISNLGSVPVYRPELLSRQLDRVMRLSLEQQLLVADGGGGSGGVTFTLPQLCQWHAKDFSYAELGSAALRRAGVEEGPPSASVAAAAVVSTKAAIALSSRSILSLLTNYLR